jgi:hypothetical protein
MTKGIWFGQYLQAAGKRKAYVTSSATWKVESIFAKQPCVFAILRIDWDRVSKTRVALYREEDGSCPFIEWFDKLPAKAQDKCYLR